MKITEIVHKFNEIFSIFINWFWEVTAFVLLPLIIYIIVFLSLNIQISQLIGLPEWMFISIIFYGNTLKKTIIYLKIHDWHFETNSIAMISCTILGISISSVLLAFSIIAKYKELDLSSFYYPLQLGIFLFALISSVVYELIIKMKIKI